MQVACPVCAKATEIDYKGSPMLFQCSGCHKNLIFDGTHARLGKRSETPTPSAGLPARPPSILLDPTQFGIIVNSMDYMEKELALIRFRVGVTALIMGLPFLLVGICVLVGLLLWLLGEIVPPGFSK